MRQIPTPKKPSTPNLIKKDLNGIDLNQQVERTVTISSDPFEFEKEFGFNPTNVNILICTPAYGGLVYVNFMHSLINTFNMLSHSNIRYGFKTITNESLITRGRNTCVSYFLSHPEYTHLLFIDADISFSKETVIKLLRANKDVVSAVYPKKGIEWDRLPELVVSEAVIDGKLVKEKLKTIQPKLLSYVVNFSSDRMQVQQGCVKVKDAPTGFMMIKRETFEVLKTKYPDLTYTNDLNLDDTQHHKDSFYLFFDCMKDPIDGRYLSEDYAFCRLVQMAGLECWVEITSPLTHTGTYNFEGDVSNLFQVER